MAGMSGESSVGTTDPLAVASAFEADGRLLDAIRLLTEANRVAHDSRFETRLVVLRNAAFDTVDHALPADLPAPVTASGAAGRLPERRRADLDLHSLREGFAEQGCVLVRELIPRARAVELADGIDRVLASFDERAAGIATPSTSSPTGSSWYVPFEPPAGRYRVGGRRNWVRASGAVWTVESPRMLFELCELLDETGIGELVTEYLGERPALSANKCTLRRVPVDTNTNWHQDGAFLGPDVRSVNLWLALSDCGDDSPGLEIVPRRLDTVLPTGTDGAMFDWSVSPNLVDEVARDTPVIAPHFRAGDALLFDHLLLHRTAVGPQMTRERYAMENWLFAPSSYPDGQIPLVY
jgi:Phytanoyl-CoA dioxygenase (PhyH)